MKEHWCLWTGTLGNISQENEGACCHLDHPHHKLTKSILILRECIGNWQANSTLLGNTVDLWMDRSVELEEGMDPPAPLVICVVCWYSSGNVSPH